MKIPITFKDPDGVFDGIRDAIKSSLSDVGPLSGDEREDLIDKRQEKITELLSQWISEGEYLSVIFDTEEGTAKVEVKNY